MIETTVAPLPPVRQVFERGLLTHRFPKYSEGLWDWYVYVKERLLKRAQYSPQKYKKCLELEQEFLKLYERAKTEEENPQKKEGNRAEGPFYSPYFTSKRDETLYLGLLKTSRSYTIQRRCA